MILSIDEIFSDAQAITTTTISTNVIDLGAAGTPYDAKAPVNHDVGDGTMVPFLAQVVADFNNATSITVALETGSTTTLGTVVLQQTIPLAQLKAGKQLSFQYLPHDLTERYLGVRYTVKGAAPSVGAFTSGITMGNQTNVTGA